MKLTRASCYALHAVAYLAQQKTNDPIASQHIAEARGIQPRFLLKVLKPLVTARILQSIKGPTGGYKLHRPPSEITVLEIIEAASQEPIQGYVPFSHDGSPSVNKKIEAVCCL